MFSPEISSASKPRLLDPGDPGAGGRLGRALDSSRIVAPLRRFGRGSVLVRAVVRVVRSGSRGWSWAAGRVPCGTPTRAFPHALGLLSKMAVVVWVDRCFVMAGRAWELSTVKDAGVDRMIVPLDSWERVRLIGWMVSVAAIVHALLAPLNASGAWPGMPVWPYALAFGIILIAACRPIALAWQHWRRPHS
jgi:hypothetical protein